MKSFAFLSLSLCILGANAGCDFIDPCHWSDNDCLLKSSNQALPTVARNGIPELEVDPMEPLDFKGKTINGDTGDLKLKFKDMIVKNLSKCKVDYIERPDKLHMNMIFYCPLTATGEYESSGQLLGLDVFGHGDFDIRTENLKIITNITMAEFEKDGEQYYKFTKFDYKYEPVEKFEYIFKNLYDGDVERAKPVVQLLNVNWKDIFNVCGKEIMDECIRSVIVNISNLFSKCPHKYLELP